MNNDTNLNYPLVTLIILVLAAFVVWMMRYNKRNEKKKNTLQEDLKPERNEQDNPLV